MITDDISTLFGGGGPGVRFRQGTILSWNPNTGENTIDMAGGTLTNVPILNTGEAIALKAGHVVGLLGQGLTWFIVGRVTPPGDSNFAAASVAFGSAGAQVFNFGSNTVPTIKATSDELVVPDWADEAIVMVTGMTGVLNTQATKQWLSFEVGCEGGGGGAYSSDVASGFGQSILASSRNHFTGLSGGEVLQIHGAVTSSATFATTPSNSMFIHAIAVYKSNI